MRHHVGIATFAIFAFLSSGLITADNSNNVTTESPSHSSTAESTMVPKSTSPPTVNPTTRSSVETTSVPPTTSSAPSTTTSTPSTTTSVPPSTTVKPDDDVGTWNTTCIIMKMKVEFVYRNSSFNHVLSPKAKDDGSECDDKETQLLVLEDDMYKLSFIFFNDTNNIYVRNISAEYPNGTTTEKEDTSGKFFAVSAKKSFKCDAQEEVKFKDLVLKFTKVQVQGFVTEGKFDEADKCDADITLNDFVPIAVACVLAAMVIIILISYLVFRRQSRQRGYQSV